MFSTQLRSVLLPWRLSPSVPLRERRFRPSPSSSESCPKKLPQLSGFHHIPTPGFHHIRLGGFSPSHVTLRNTHTMAESSSPQRQPQQHSQHPPSQRRQDGTPYSRSSQRTLARDSPGRPAEPCRQRGSWKQDSLLKRERSMSPEISFTPEVPTPRSQDGPPSASPAPPAPLLSNEVRYLVVKGSPPILVSPSCRHASHQKEQHLDPPV